MGKIKPLSAVELAYLREDRDRGALPFDEEVIERLLVTGINHRDALSRIAVCMDIEEARAIANEELNSTPKPNTKP